MNVSKLTIKLKLLLMGGITGAFFITLGIISFYSISTTNATLKQLYKGNLLGTEKIGKINALMRDNRILLLLSLQHDPRMSSSKLHDHPISQHTDKVTKNIEEISAIWESYKAIPFKDEEQKKLAETYAENCSKFVTDGLKPTMAAALKGDFDNAVHLTLNAINPLATTTFKAADDLYAKEYSLAKQSYEKAQNDFGRIKAVTFAAIIAAMIIGTLINIAAIRSISRGADILKEAAGKMAAGDLTVSASVKSNDEIGQIAHSFNAMRDSFASLISQVSGSAVQLGTSANQVNSTAENMATGAEQTAAQAGTVATASEEMAATSSEIAMNSQMAAEGAQYASQAALNGATVVQNTIDVMSQIAERVRETARSVKPWVPVPTRSAPLSAQFRILPNRPICWH